MHPIENHSFDSWVCHTQAWGEHSLCHMQYIYSVPNRSFLNSLFFLPTVLGEPGWTGGLQLEIIQTCFRQSDNMSSQCNEMYCMNTWASHCFDTEISMCNYLWYIWHTVYLVLCVRNNDGYYNIVHHHNLQLLIKKHTLSLPTHLVLSVLHVPCAKAAHPHQTVIHNLIL